MWAEAFFSLFEKALRSKFIPHDYWTLSISRNQESGILFVHHIHFYNNTVASWWNRCICCLYCLLSVEKSILQKGPYDSCIKVQALCPCSAMAPKDNQIYYLKSHLSQIWSININKIYSRKTKSGHFLCGMRAYPKSSH